MASSAGPELGQVPSDIAPNLNPLEKEDYRIGKRSEQDPNSAICGDGIHRPQFSASDRER
jgi:hypothetical protein